MSRSKPLLILPCSGAKLPGLQPASVKYTGAGYWGLLRTLNFNALREACDVIIVSALYGVVYLHDLLDDYDQTLTAERFNALSTDPVQRKRFLNALPETDQPVYLACPKTYRQLVEVWGDGALSQYDVYTFIAGSGIGSQRGQLKAWVQTLLSDHQQHIQRDSIDVLISFAQGPDGRPQTQTFHVGDEAYYRDEQYNVAGPRTITAIEEPANGCYRVYFDGLSEPVRGVELSPEQVTARQQELKAQAIRNRPRHVSSHLSYSRQAA